MWQIFRHCKDADACKLKLACTHSPWGIYDACPTPMNDVRKTKPTNSYSRSYLGALLSIIMSCSHLLLYWVTSPNLGGQVTSQERQNSHFRHSNITQCSIPSLNYQNCHISLSSLFLGSFSSLNYKNGHFSPKNLLLGSLSSLNYRSGYFSPRTFLFGSSSLLISMFFHNSTTVNYMPCFAREARYTWVT